LIGSTRTRQGLDVHAWLDEKQYQKGRKIKESELAELRITPNKLHSNWNYEIHPRT
jgi:hypothetical protein